MQKKYFGASIASAAALISLIIVAAAFLMQPGFGSSETTHRVTVPPPPGMHQATFAAGCFWSMQAIFQEIKGVVKVDPGYAGGTAMHPSYQEVGTGLTGYAETANITYNPKIVSYKTLLRVLLTARNPTTLNQQGPDYGTDYRSIIFYRSAKQKREALAMINEINAAHVWKSPIVTTVQPFHAFWRAESYHLNYFAKHPNQPYCAYVIAPEVANFRRLYPALLKK